jgi:ferric-dicitrate binding protein FerR (iron transport regulator)
VEKQNAKGVKSTITLPEGSKIWLNADSKLSYPVAFNDKTREVYLRGEAFFDIRKNPDKPFIIHLANGTIHVLGTSFNVRAYDDEDKIETSVSTGKVAFIPKSPRQTRPDTVFLTRDKKVSYRFGSGELVTQATRSSVNSSGTSEKRSFSAARRPGSTGSPVRSTTIRWKRSCSICPRPKTSAIRSPMTNC